MKSKNQKANYRGLDCSLLVAFNGCHNRVKIGKSPSIQWPRTREGYAAFMKEIGPKPKDMTKPSVGRKNHDKGYVKGNVRWEEHKFNSVKRRGTKFHNETSAVVELSAGPAYRRGSQGWIDNSSRGSQKRWSDPKQKEAARKRMIGNQFAAGRVFTEEERKAVGAIHKGNKYNLGKKLPKSTKAKMKIAQRRRRLREKRNQSRRQR